ncbi:MAG TPA: helix-turn-helix transcriptional regulator [Polyangiaceae bacterium]|jgi:transcriptional regulator with XRE-family HTH domain
MALGSGPRRRVASVRPPARTDDPKAFAAVVGEAVRRARQACGWTQAQLAEAAGFSANYIARLERGELGPSLFVANQLCSTLGIPVSTLTQAPAPAKTTRRRIAG